jgi:membrane complex biogenesis BtpA family protein
MSNHARKLVGVIHLPPLPGSPRSAQSGRECARIAAEEARILEGAGFDLVMIENFGDAPFFATKVPPITIAAMTACAVAVREACPTLALGVNVLRNDAESALAIAAVIEAACVRINVHTGARVTDQGLIEGRAAETLRARRALGADRIAIWADVDVKHSAPLAARSLAQEAEDTALRGMAELLLVTGEGTGRTVDAAKLEAVRRAVPSVPVLVASGATVDSLPVLAELSDGVIVGSALREGGRAGRPLDPARIEAFARAFRAVFGPR